MEKSALKWNIAFYHLCNYVLRRKLAEFNSTYKIRYPKKWRDASVQAIMNYDDFSIDLKESEVIEICKSANIINHNLYKPKNPFLQHAIPDQMIVPVSEKVSAIDLGRNARH